MISLCIKNQSMKYLAQHFIDALSMMLLLAIEQLIQQ